jgi:hypothetical protein
MEKPLAVYELSPKLSFVVRESKFPNSPCFVSVKRQGPNYWSSIDLSLAAVKVLSTKLEDIHAQMTRSPDTSAKQRAEPFSLTERISVGVEHFHRNSLNYLCFSSQPPKVSLLFPSHGYGQSP